MRLKSILCLYCPSMSDGSTTMADTTRTIDTGKATAVTTAVNSDNYSLPDSLYESSSTAPHVSIAGIVMH